MGISKCDIGKAVSAIIIVDERVLLVKRGAGSDARLALPGGPACAGETPEVTVSREVREETGLEVRPVTLAGVHFGGAEWLAAFNCEIVGGGLSRECDAEYVDVDEALIRRDVSELSRLLLAGRERALEKDVMYDMKNEGCSLYL